MSILPHGLAGNLAMADAGEAEAILREALVRIRADREHGASWLAREAARALARAAMAAESAGHGTGRRGGLGLEGESWRQLARELAHARPSMAAVAVTVAGIMAAGGSAPDERTALAAIRDEAERRAAAWDAAAEAIAAQGRALLVGTVLTHSRSGTVEEVMRRLAADPVGQVAGVIVTESRPGGEGVATARALAAAGLAVTLVAEAAVGLMAAEASCVALGADSLRADGSLVNKVGTYPLALAARAAGIPVYVVSETVKVAPDGWPLELEEGETGGLLAAPIPGVRVRAALFERTPAGLLSSIITEEGVLRPDELRPYAERAARDLAALDG